MKPISPVMIEKNAGGTEELTPQQQEVLISLSACVEKSLYS